MLEIKKLHRPINVTGLWGALDDIYLPGYYFPGEFHDFWEIVFVRSGSMTATGDGRVYRLSTGDAVFHKPMEFHTVRIDESGTRLVRISFSAVGIGMKRFEDRMATLRDDEIGLFLIVAKKFATAMKCHNEGDMAGFETAGNSGAVMLETLLLLLSGRPDGTNRDLSQDEKRWLDIVSVMKDNIGEMLSVPELAARCNMGVSSFKKAMHSVSDVGAAKFFLGMKLRRVMEMLDSGSTLKEAAFSVGFTDMNYFSTVFRRETGMTAREYMRIGREEDEERM